MDYSQKIQNKAEEIQHLSDAFEEVRTTLSVLTAIEATGESNYLGGSIQKIIHAALDELDAIECKIEHDYIEKN